MDQRWEGIQSPRSKSLYRRVHEEDVQPDQVQIIPATAESMGIRESSGRTRQRELLPQNFRKRAKRVLSTAVACKAQGSRGKAWIAGQG